MKHVPKGKGATKQSGMLSSLTPFSLFLIASFSGAVVCRIVDVSGFLLFCAQCETLESNHCQFFVGSLQIVGNGLLAVLYELLVEQA